MKISAMVVRDRGGEFGLEALTLDEPREDEVLVRIVATGMCHTDLIVRDLGICAMPMVLGHEGAGVVETVGAGVKHVKRGDHVVLTFNSCGACRSCDSGHEAYCAGFAALNLAGRRRDGSTTLRRGGDAVHGSFFSQSSFADYALAQARNVVPVRRDAPLEFLGPLGCGVQTGAGAVMNVLKPWPNSSLAVFGAGAVGLSAVMAAKIEGCARIVAVDPVRSRLDMALSMGATDVVQVRDGFDTGEALAASGPFDFSVDTSGVATSIQQSVASLTRQGVCALVSSGKPGTTVSFPVSHLTGGRRILSIVEGDSQPQTYIPQLVDLYLGGKLPFDRMIRFYNFEQINQAAADSLSGVTVKPVIRFGAIPT